VSPERQAATIAAGTRRDGRAADKLRSVTIEPGFVPAADGSVLTSIGNTMLICTASVSEGVPPWREASGKGWVTAEYGMLPASTGVRRQRDSARGRPDGRTIEIQRLIGRSLRAAVDFRALGPRTVSVDCDVVQADGGTRCAGITGGYVALELALLGLVERGVLKQVPLATSVGAVSCGLVDGVALLDLDYGEDSRAEVDMNVVMTGDDGLVEVQATGEQITPVARRAARARRRGNRKPARASGEGGAACDWCWGVVTRTSCVS
jgi:ribonuclease PH